MMNQAKRRLGDCVDHSMNHCFEAIFIKDVLMVTLRKHYTLHKHFHMYLQRDNICRKKKMSSKY